MLNKTRLRSMFAYAFVFIIGNISAQNIKLDVPNIAENHFAHFDSVNNKYTIVDSTGRCVFPMQFEQVKVFDEFYSKNMFLDSENELYKNHKYFYKTYLEETILFLQSHAVVAMGEKQGFIDLETGELLLFDITINMIDAVCFERPLNATKDNNCLIDFLFVYCNYLKKYKMIVLSNENSPFILMELYRCFENLFSFMIIPTEPFIDYEPYFVAVSSDQSYNVNVFDKSGNWYETGLLIESSDKVYIKLTEGKFETIKSSDKRYKYEIKEKELYVK